MDREQVLGRGKCPHCGEPISTALPLYERHMKNCKKNPDNWDDIDDEAKQWITNLEDK